MTESKVGKQPRRTRPREGRSHRRAGGLSALVVAAALLGGRGPTASSPGPRRGESDSRDGFALSWINDGTETPMRGNLERVLSKRHFVTGSVAGQLLPTQ